MDNPMALALKKEIAKSFTRQLTFGIPTNEDAESLKKIARKYLETYSIIGRKVFNKAISRPYLIKGLEFNHAILLDADALKPKELYVSITRGSNYLTVLSKEKVLRSDY